MSILNNKVFKKYLQGLMKLKVYTSGKLSYNALTLNFFS
jgi:hypothetical protein